MRSVRSFSLSLNYKNNSFFSTLGFMPLIAEFET